MTDDATPPPEPVAPEAVAPAEPAPAPLEMPVEPAAQPVEPESTHLPANESISEALPESISEPQGVPEPSPAASTAKPVETHPPVTQPSPGNPREMLTRANTIRHAKMQKNLDAIMAELGKTGTISNNGVQKLLKCSNASAIRYLSMLVKHGKIRKEGKGRGVVYVKI